MIRRWHVDFCMVPWTVQLIFVPFQHYGVHFIYAQGIFASIFSFCKSFTLFRSGFLCIILVLRIFGSKCSICFFL